MQNIGFAARKIPLETVLGITRTVYNIHAHYGRVKLTVEFEYLSFNQYQQDSQNVSMIFTHQQ